MTAPSIATRPSTLKIWGALSVVYVVWGSTYFAIRVVVETMPALLMASARFLIAGAVLFLIGIKEKGQPIRAVHWRSAFIIGGALLLGGNGSVVVAEETVPSGIAALLIASAPLWFAVHSRIFLKEKLARLATIGVIVGFAGIAFLSWPRSGAGRIDPFGLGLLLFAPMSWAAGSLYSKLAPEPDRPLTSTGMHMLAGGVLLAIASALRGELADVNIDSFSGASWIAFGYLILFGSLAAFTAYIWVLKNASTTLVSTYAYVNPVVAIFLGWAFLDERFGPTTMVAAAVILVGVAMMVMAGSPKAIEDETPTPIEPTG